MGKMYKKPASAKPKRMPIGSRKTSSRQVARRKTALPKPNIAKLVRKVCSITDPFCSAASGSKYFDDTGVKTTPYSAHSQSVATTNSTGEYCILVVPGYSYQASIGTSLGGSCSFTTLTQVIPFSFNASNYRIVSYGLRIKNITAPLNSSGVVRIRGIGSSRGVDLGTVNSNLYHDFYEDVPLQNCTDLCVVGRRSSEAHHFFNAPGTTNPSAVPTDWVSNGWAPLLVSVIGAPASTAILQIEFFFNYELTWPDGDSMNLMTTPSPPSNTLLTTASSQVQQSIGNVFTRGIKEVENVVVKYAAKAIGSAVGSYFGPAGAAAGGSMAALMVD